MCQILDWFLFLFHPSLLWVCLHQISTCYADTYPGTHLSTYSYSWADLFRIGVSGREKAGRKFKQSWCWDFIVSRDVYELLLTRIWLQQVRYWRAGREREEVLPFPVSSKGGNEQKNSMKQSLLKRRLELEQQRAPSKNEGEPWTQKPKRVLHPRIPSNGCDSQAATNFYQQLIGLIAKTDHDKILKRHSEG